MAAKDIISFAKLNGTNYNVWSFKMKLFLTKEQVWDVVETEIKVEDRKADFEKKNQKAYADIGLCIEDNLIQYIKDTTSAHVAWKNLERHHIPKTRSNRVQVIRTICRMRLAKSGNMDDHISLLMENVEKLKTMGDEKFAEKYAVSFLLNSLPDEYDNLMTAMDSIPESELTLDYVKERLKSEWVKKNQQSLEETSALKVSSGSSKAKECYFCHKPGHYKRECREFKRYMTNQKKDNRQNQAKSAKCVFSAEDDREKDWIFFLKDETESDSWYVDSGSAFHICNDRKFFTKLDENFKDNVKVANGVNVPVDGIGEGLIDFMDGEGQNYRKRMTNVYFVPELKGNLLSVTELTEKGFEVLFLKDICKIMLDGKTVAVGDKVKKLYKLRQVDKRISVVSGVRSECIHSWHQLLGHRNIEAIKLMSKLADGVKIKGCNCKFTCEVCIRGKMARMPFPQKSLTTSKNVMDLVHTDVCGPMQTVTPGGKKYFVTFVDDYSKYTVVYLLREKSEVYTKFIEYLEMVKTIFGKRPKVIRSDRGGEYLAGKVQQQLKSKGIAIQYTVPYSPEQNGTAERKNRYLVEMVRCMLFDANLDNRFWGEALITANFLQNRLPTRATDATPFERWHEFKPRLSFVHRFGEYCYALIPKEHRRKLDEKAIKLRFMGYDENSKGFRLIDESTMRIVISRDVKFLDGDQSTSLSKTSNVEQSSSNVDAEVELDDDHGIQDDKNEADESVDEENYQSFIDAENIEPDNVAESTPIVPRKSARTNLGQKPQYLDDYEVGALYQNSIQEEPQSYDAAINGPDSKLWKIAMEDEMNSIIGNKTWDLVKLPADRKAIGCKWIFKIKRDERGNAVRFKARLVAQGFGQVEGVDFSEVYAPVVRLTTFRTLLAIASKRKMHVMHFDAKTAFLNGNLSEEIFMRQPKGFEIGKDGEYVCRLRKSLYGLKQAAKSWNDVLHMELCKLGLKQSIVDHCLYTKDKELYVLVYVDDLIVASTNRDLISKFETEIKSKFEIKCLGQVKQYLGMEVQRDKNGDFSINQSQYIREIINMTGLSDAKISKTPIDVGYFKLKDDNTFDNKMIYHKVIGQLLYVSVNTRPDIAASVSILSQKVTNPSTKDWNELKRILRYLKGSIDLKLKCSQNGKMMDLIGYCDADWAEDSCDRKSRSGFIFTYNGGTVSWASRKQHCVALSTAEAEYVALTEACQELSWLQALLNEFGEKVTTPTTIFEDNQSTLKMIQSDKFSNRTKHMDLKFHFIKEMNHDGLVDFVYCPSTEMTADILTKPIQGNRILKLREMIGLH